MSANGSHITRIEVRDEQSLVLYAYSGGAMDREIPLEILRPEDTGVPPRPTLYLLNGAGGGEDGATWSARTDAASFLADKNVNVVTPRWPGNGAITPTGSGPIRCSASTSGRLS